MSELAIRIDALRKGRWHDWQGLPEGSTLAMLDARFGGSTVLDESTAIGSERIACTRSSMNDAPIEAWHRDGVLLLVACDYGAKPLAVRDAPRDRLDVAWGAALLDGGEWVWPERGLAQVVVDGAKAVQAFGFAPATLAAYLATRRASSAARPKPLPMSPAKGAAR